MTGLGVYVHVPFCAARCPYCDFATAPATSRLRADYLAALETEIAREGTALGRPRARTLFFGGGTPSLLEPGEIASLGAVLRSAFDLRPREVTIEANPATLDRARLEAWCELGLTRLSLGAQSFTAAGLRALGRTHQPEDVPPAVAAARSLGLAVSLDLIFGWPGQTASDWHADLDQAVALDPDHLSAYPLELRLDPEEGLENWPGGGWPSLERWRAKATTDAPDEDRVAAMYELAEEKLGQAGFRHYEIANWARPGKQCLHNLGYWRNRDWIGLGVGAHSNLSGRRSRNHAGLVDYIAGITESTGRIPDENSDEAVDVAMLALRLDQGLALDQYAGTFGLNAADQVRMALGTVEPSLIDWQGGRVVLTARGRLLANEVFAAILPD